MTWGSVDLDDSVRRVYVQERAIERVAGVHDRRAQSVASSRRRRLPVRRYDP